MDVVRASLSDGMQPLSHQHKITLLGLLPVLYAARQELCRVVLTAVPDFGRKV